jgi:hypothetical protein
MVECLSRPVVRVPPSKPIAGAREPIHRWGRSPDGGHDCDHGLRMSKFWTIGSRAARVGQQNQRSCHHPDRQARNSSSPRMHPSKTKSKGLRGWPQQPGGATLAVHLGYLETGNELRSTLERRLAGGERVSPGRVAILALQTAGPHGLAVARARAGRGRKKSPAKERACVMGGRTGPRLRPRFNAKRIRRADQRLRPLQRSPLLVIGAICRPTEAERLSEPFHAVHSC